MTFTEAINEIVTKLTTLKTDINTFLTSRSVANVNTLTQVPAALYSALPKAHSFTGFAQREGHTDDDYVTLIAHGYSFDGVNFCLTKVGSSTHLQFIVMTDPTLRKWGPDGDDRYRILIRTPSVQAGTNLSIGNVNCNYDSTAGTGAIGDNVLNSTYSEKYYMFDIESVSILNNAETASGSINFVLDLQKNKSTQASLSLSIPFTIHK